MRPVRVLTRSDVERLLGAAECVAAVEGAFRLRGEGGNVRSAVLGIPAEGGGIHVKAAMMDTGAPYFAVKANANFPGNPAAHGLPTIQGMLALFDAANGEVLALMDSIGITILRTAAATAVAAKYLSSPRARTATIVGCGAQALAQLRALCVVRELSRVHVLDVDAVRRASFAAAAREALSLEVLEATDLIAAARASDIVVTCTTSRLPFLGTAHLSPGAFVGAVGADSEHKSEVEPSLLARAAVVVDSLEQCVAIGDLHHAVAAGAMTAGDVRAELSDVVVTPERGRRGAEEIVVFDSTGVAFQDVAAAALVYERAVAAGLGVEVRLSS